MQFDVRFHPFVSRTRQFLAAARPPGAICTDGRHGTVRAASKELERMRRR